MKIGVDVDGVCANFVKGFHLLLNTLHGLQIDPNHQPTVYDWWGPDLGLTQEQVHAGLQHIVRYPSFWATLEPLPGATRLLKTLVDLSDRHEIYFITIRSPMCAAKLMTEVWLACHGYPCPTVLVVASKGSIAKGFPLDILIEDCTALALDVATQSPQTQIYIADAKYNKDAPCVFRGSVNDIATELTRWTSSRFVLPKG